MTYEKTTDKLEDELLNGGGEDLRTQSRGLAWIIRELRRQREELVALRARVDDLPATMAATVAVHAQSCAVAKKTVKRISSSIKIGKDGVTATGIGVIAIVLGLVIISVTVYFFRVPIGQWLSTR